MKALFLHKHKTVIKMHCVKEFIMSLKEKVDEAGMKLDGVLFDYGSYDEYIASCSDTDVQMFISIEHQNHCGSISFMIDMEKRVISLVASNGYDWFAVGTPKDIDTPSIHDSLISLATNLLSNS